MSNSTPVDAAPSYRRRIALTAVGALGVVALVAATTALLDTDKTLRVLAPADGAPPPQATALDVPVGFRLVGSGDIAIAVPEAWGTNDLRCGTPKGDTVVIDVGVVPACLALRPVGVESVSVFGADPNADETAGSAVTIGGRAAERTATTCGEEPDSVEGDAPILCSASVRFPAEGVGFRAESSTGKAEVDEILDRVRLVPGFVGVPGFRENGDDRESSQERYVADLQSAGFVVEVREESRPGMPGGFVLDAAPQPGTVLRPGDTVVVTVTGAPDGLAEEVYVLMAATDSDGGEGQRLDDEQVREGATITMPVGGVLRVYGKGPDDLFFGGDLDGISIEFDTAPGKNGAAYWRAVQPGTTRLTVTVTRGEVRDVVGVVTVIVR